ncbi:MAG: hypothetical protein QOE31_2410 [Solirubrobacteraceae bacterium]|nr:hypothetical protein [Solirubrobacteraceae bacterium]
MPAESNAAPVFEEWGRITRFLESARLAFARERNLWTGLEIATSDDVRLSAPAGQGIYKVRLSQHLAAIQDDETLFASVLIHSYALTEFAASDRLKVASRDLGGIENWGGRLLETTKKDWTDVKGQKAGAVEVAVVRNALAHGSRTIDEVAAARLATVGVARYSPGDAVTLGHDELREFRARLLSLLNVGGVGKL